MLKPKASKDILCTLIQIHQYPGLTYVDQLPDKEAFDLLKAMDLIDVAHDSDGKPVTWCKYVAQKWVDDLMERWADLVSVTDNEMEEVLREMEEVLRNG